MVNNCQSPNTFIIIVDRLEGNYAICEFPDETMCDVLRTSFPEDVKDREKYEVFINSQGNIQVVKRHEVAILPENRHKLPSRLVRIS